MSRVILKKVKVIFRDKGKDHLFSGLNRNLSIQGDESNILANAHAVGFGLVCDLFMLGGCAANVDAGFSCHIT